MLGRLGELVERAPAGPPRRDDRRRDGASRSIASGRLGGAPLGRGDPHLPRGRAVEDPGDAGAGSPTSCCAWASAATAASWRSAAASPATWRGSSPRPTCAASRTCRCPPPCSPCSTRRSAARPAWTPPQGRISSAPSIRPSRCWPIRCVLATLPEREYRAGLAEAVKHGLIADREYFDWIEREADALVARDAAALEHWCAEAWRSRRRW